MGHLRAYLQVACLVLAGWSCTAAGEEVVPLTIEEPCGVDRTDWPVTSGIPFARGQIASGDEVRLIETGRVKELPSQSRVTCRWPDGSVKWILLDSRVSLTANEKKHLRLIHGGGAAGRGGPGGIDVEEDADTIQIKTGAMMATFSRKEGGAIRAMLADFDADGKCGPDEQLSGPWTLVLEMADGHVYRNDVLPAEVKLEERGSLRSAVRIEGRLADEKGVERFRYLVRLHFYAGQSFVRACVTLIVDVPDQLMVDVRSFRIVLPTDGAYRPEVVFGGEVLDRGAAVHGPIDATAGRRLFQFDDQQYLIDGQRTGKRPAGWMARSGNDRTLAVGVRHFWQQWPKALTADAHALTVELIPSFAEGTYDEGTPADESQWTYLLRHGRTRIKVGVAKTHELIVCGHGPKTSPAMVSEFFRKAFEPLLATCEPAYICDTKALGDFPPADPAHADRFMGYDAVVAKAFKEHVANREKIREYGLLNFGDWWGERGYNWGNLEYDMQRGLIAQYARTGNREYYVRAEQAARHHVDVDVVHAVNGLLKNPSGPPPAVGHVWVHATGHTGGYFPDGAFKLERPYTQGYSLNLGHVWDRGDLDYYFLSGDEWAREVALQIAERLRTDAAPHFKIGTHMRDIGWPMLAMMAAYRATGDTKYLDAVRHGWEVLKSNEDAGGGWVITLAKGHCLHEGQRCKGNVDFIMGIVISALCDYHRETGDPEVAKTIVRAVDFTLRETYLPDRKMFRYTSCPLTQPTPTRISLLSESLSCAWRLSGDEKYLRVLREATDVFHQSLQRSGAGKGFSMHLIFSPEGLWGLDRPPVR